MQTDKQARIVQIALSLASLELIGNDTERLAKRIDEGQKDFTREQFADILTHACRETIAEEEDFLIRFTGMDIVIYTHSGYAVIDRVAGLVDFCYLYGAEGECFESMTAHYREDEIDLCAA